VKEIKAVVDDDLYWAVKEKAARNKLEIDEYLQGLIEDDTGVEVSTPEEDPEFRKFVRRELNLEDENKQSHNVVRVIDLMRTGYEYNDALRQRAKEYRNDHPDISSEYYKTVGSHCTRGLGFTGNGATDEFRAKARNLIEKYENKTA